jgi:hypothetical protein
MGRGKELSAWLQTKIVEGKALGLTYKQLHLRHGVTISTLKYIILSKKKHILNKSQSCTGRLHKINKPTRDLLYDTAFYTSNRITWSGLTGVVL